MMLLAEAEAAVHAQLSLAVGRESVPLAEARGRILGRDLISPLDLPPHDNAAVDGYALSDRDLPESGTARLRLAGRAAAGRPFTGVVLRGEAARILTGAPLPAGTDTVVMPEGCAVDGDNIHVLRLTR